MKRATSTAKIGAFGAICATLLSIPLVSFFAEDRTGAAVSPSTITSAAAPPVAAPPSQNFHQWGSVTLFNGLPADNVRAVAQTSDGIMWFGTDKGLARFDGRRIETETLGESTGLKILALTMAPDGRLWIGTDNGAFVYANGHFNAIDGLKGLAVNAILPGDPTVAATSDQRLFKVSIDTDNTIKTQTTYEPGNLEQARPAEFTSLARSKNGLIAGSYGRGLLRFDQDRPTDFVDDPPYVNALAQDVDGNTWLGADSASGSGLYSLPAGGGAHRIGADLGNVLSLAPDGRDGVWAGTAKAGLFHFHGESQAEHFTLENTAGGLRSNIVNAVFVDREGVVWVGTNRGVCRYDGSSPSIQTLSDNSSENFVRTLFRTSDGKILAGTNRGLYSFGNEKWSEVKGSPARTVYALGEGSDGNLLIGGPGGVTDGRGRQFAAGDIRAFARFGAHTYAAAFDRGLIPLNDPGSPPIIAGESPTTLFSTQEKLWIGTANGGLFSFDGSLAKAEPGIEALAGSAIWRIGPRSENELWLATARGLFLYKEGELRSVVPNFDVRDIIADGSDVWAATQNGGLLHVRYDELFGWVVSDLNVEQGMPSQQVFSILKQDDRLLVGTNRGIVNYAPGTVLPKIVVSRVLSRRLYDADEWENEISLEYPQNSLLVEMAGQSSRTFPEQFQYAFLLKDSEGKILDKRLARDAQYSPSNLGPGSYTIESRAFNKDLLFSDPVIIRFSVARAPFPWTATALAILLIVALIALAWAVLERRRIVDRNRQLAEARFDLANEAERERSRIARDLHDQTLADLRDLMMMSDRLAPGNSDFRSEIEQVSIEIRRICEDLSPSVLENVGLIPALEFLLSRTIENGRFETTETIGDVVELSVNFQLQIYRIAQEVLTNIKRHSTASLITMRAGLGDDRNFELTIVDDGSPFIPADENGNGRGIANIRLRATLIGADISWTSSDDEGNSFQLRKTLT